MTTTWRQRRCVLFCAALLYAIGTAMLHPVVDSLYISHYLHTHVHARDATCSTASVTNDNTVRGATATTADATTTTAMTQPSRCAYVSWSTLATWSVSLVLYAAWQLYAAMYTSRSTQRKRASDAAAATMTSARDDGGGHNSSKRRSVTVVDVVVGVGSRLVTPWRRGAGAVVWWAVCFVLLWLPATTHTTATTATTPLLPLFVVDAWFVLRLALFADASARMRAYVQRCGNSGNSSSGSMSPSLRLTPAAVRSDDVDAAGSSNCSSSAAVWSQLSPPRQWLLLLVRCLVGCTVICVATWLYERQQQQQTAARSGHAFVVYMLLCALAASPAALLCCRLLDKPPSSSSNSSSNSSDTLSAWCGFVQQTLRRPCMRAVVPLWALQACSELYTSAFYAMLFRATCETGSARGGKGGGGGGGVTSAAAAADVIDGRQHMTAAMLVVYALLLTSSVSLPCVLTPLLQALRGGGSGTLLTTRHRVAVLLTLRSVVAVVSYTSAAVASARTSRSSGNNDSSSHHGACVGVAVVLCVDVVLVTALRIVHDEAVWRDVVDEDVVVYARGSARVTAAQLRTLRAVVVRTSQCVALLVGCTFALQHGDMLTSTAATTRTTRARAVTVVYAVSLQAAVTSTPTLLAWLRCYNLDDAHLRFVQLATHKRVEAASIKVI